MYIKTFHMQLALVCARAAATRTGHVSLWGFVVECCSKTEEQDYNRCWSYYSLSNLLHPFPITDLGSRLLCKSTFLWILISSVATPPSTYREKKNAWKNLIFC